MPNDKARSKNALKGKMEHIRTDRVLRNRAEAKALHREINQASTSAASGSAPVASQGDGAWRKAHGWQGRSRPPPPHAGGASASPDVKAGFAGAPERGPVQSRMFVRRP